MRQRAAIIKRRVGGRTGTDKYLWDAVAEFEGRGIKTEVWSIRGKGERRKQIREVRSPPLCGRLGDVITLNYVLQRRIKKEAYCCILSLDKTTFHTHIRAGGGCHRGWLERRARYLPAWRRASLWIEPYHRVVLSIERKGFTAPWVRKIIANSEMVKREIMEYYGVDEERIAVVHNGVEWDELGGGFEEALVRQRELKRQRGLNPNRFYFLFVGSGFERKGLRFAMEALGRLPREASLLVVGRDHRDGRYRDLAQRLGLEGRVIFLGVQRDVVPFYQVADAFVLPTIYDPFSNATLEALAMGLFCVTTKGNGCSEVMADYAGVVIDDPRDTEALAEAMAKAMGGGIDRRRIRESVAHLTLDQHISKVVDICLEGGP